MWRVLGLEESCSVPKFSKIINFFRYHADYKWNFLLFWKFKMNFYYTFSLGIYTVCFLNRRQWEAHRILYCCTVLFRDQTDERNVHLFDTNSGKPLNDGKPFTHKQEVDIPGIISRGIAWDFQEGEKQFPSTGSLPNRVYRKSLKSLLILITRFAVGKLDKNKHLSKKKEKKKKCVKIFRMGY